MRFDIITIFPHIFDSYLNGSMIKRARARKLVDIRVHDLRKFTRDKHKKVDDRPYGGGPGMVIKIEPLAKAIESLLRSDKRHVISDKKTKIILFSAAGKQFDAKMAGDFAKKYDRIIMIAGHYEGVDERIKSVIGNWKLKIENLSVGPYVLTGGELPAMVVVDAVSRHISGFLGKAESIEEKRHGIGVPVYTRPEVFGWPIRQAQGKRSKEYKVPPVLLSGNHVRVEEWRKKYKKTK